MTLNGNPTAAPPQDATMTELVGGIVSDAQTLIKQQFAMLRAELKQDVDRVAKASRYLGIGAALMGIGAIFLAIASVYLLSWLLPEAPLWVCWSIVSIVHISLGMVLFLVGRHWLKDMTPLPNKSLNALQENLSWIANHPS